MIKTKNPLYKTILILNLIFVLPCAACDIVGIFKFSSVFTIISFVSSALALVFAFLYIVKGYSKGQADLFKSFVIFYACATFFSLIGSLSYVPNSVSPALRLAVFGIVIVFAVGSDLGKSKSMILCAVLVALEIIRLILFICSGHASYSEQTTFILLRNISQVLIAIVLGICNFAKYLDKTVRKTN